MLAHFWSVAMDGSPVAPILCGPSHQQGSMPFHGGKHVPPATVTGNGRQILRARSGCISAVPPVFRTPNHMYTPNAHRSLIHYPRTLSSAFRRKALKSSIFPPNWRHMRLTFFCLHAKLFTARSIAVPRPYALWCISHKDTDQSRIPSFF